jgi:hypothetical protein
MLSSFSDLQYMFHIQEKILADFYVCCSWVCLSAKYYHLNTCYKYYLSSKNVQLQSDWQEITFVIKQMNMIIFHFCGRNEQRQMTETFWCLASNFTILTLQ